MPDIAIDTAVAKATDSVQVKTLSDGELIVGVKKSLIALMSRNKDMATSNAVSAALNAFQNVFLAWQGKDPSVPTVIT